jgi:uncharacterized protein with NAD-binding domain and iron-sulfur cluster
VAADPNKRPKVTIAGGGIAGITAALRLAERGYSVTLYEEKGFLGGNLASRDLGDGTSIDVYPHMFQAWYVNFWKLLEDAGVKQSESFAPFRSVHQLRREGSPKLTTLTYPYSPRYLLQNLSSEMAPPADMFVFGFAGVDLLAELHNPTVRLQNMSLTGYLNTRLYMTQIAIEAYETFVTGVWALPGYQISAADCRTYSAYCYGSAEKDSWLTRGPASETFLGKLADELNKAGVKIVLNRRIEGVTVENGLASSISLRRTKFNTRTSAWDGVGKAEPKTVDVLLLAVPPTVAAQLSRKGALGKRIVDSETELRQLSRLSSQHVPILQLFFNRKLEGIPPEPVGLVQSRLNLAFTDISQQWEELALTGKTVLAVSCSEPDKLIGPGPHDDGFAMITELASYLDFELPKKWKASGEIDWRHTRYHQNADAQLSLNAVASGTWRPTASYESIANLFLAGDYCQNHFGITTIEAAVATGLEAVNALLAQRGEECVAILKPPSPSADEFVALRYAGLPAAYAAKAFAMANARMTGGADIARAERVADGGKPDTGAPESMLRYLLTPGVSSRYRQP